MKTLHWIAAVGCIFLSAALAGAHDLTRIERKIAREPAYNSTPKFCLLAFGPEAQTHVWLALDGDVLYVDRNRNGDLTEDGERVAAKRSDNATAVEGNLWFDAGDIRAGNLTHKNLIVSVGKLNYLAEQYEQIEDYLAVEPQARGYSLGVEVEMTGWKGAGVNGRVAHLASVGDAHGLLKFADKPEAAPIIHFGGPWQVTLFGPQKLTLGRTWDLVLGVGTPGLGAGATAFVAYEGLIPPDAYPKVEVTYPTVRDGKQPVSKLYELKQRC